MTGSRLHGFMVCLLFHVRGFLWFVLSHQSGPCRGGRLISTRSCIYATKGKMLCNDQLTTHPYPHCTSNKLCAVSVTAPPSPPLPLPSGTGRQGIRTGWRAVMICSGGPTLSSVLNAATKNYDIPFS